MPGCIDLVNMTIGVFSCKSRTPSPTVLMRHIMVRRAVYRESEHQRPSHPDRTSRAEPAVSGPAGGGGDPTLGAMLDCAI